MPTTVLHLVVDPLCGWTYAAAPLMEISGDVPGLQLKIHGGGMLSGTRRQPISDNWRALVIPADKRIAEISGQPFGSRYFDELLHDSHIVLDSQPPTAALIAMESMTGDGVAALNQIQTAYYRDGKNITEYSVLSSIATDMGLRTDLFEAKFNGIYGQPTQEHIEETRGLQSTLGMTGFPTAALETGEGKMETLEISRYYGRPNEWFAHLQDQI